MDGDGRDAGGWGDEGVKLAGDGECVGCGLSEEEGGGGKGKAQA